MTDTTSTTTAEGDMAFHTESHTTWAPATNGVSQSNTIIDQKYIGSCPAGVRPGDRMPAIGSTLQKDRQSLLHQLDSVKEIQKRWPGQKVFLDAEYATGVDFQQRYRAIALRYGIDPPDVVIVRPPLDKHGAPKPQLANGSVAWGVIDGRYHDVIVVTETQRAGVSEPELLALLAHEMGHSLQYEKNGHNGRAGGRNMEDEADKLALSCPEVDPAAFKNWLLKTEKINDEVAKKHPLAAGDITGSTVIIPESLQTRLQDSLHVPFVGGHTTTSIRIRWADEEIARRAGSGQSPR
jgi:hypothetical protein